VNSEVETAFIRTFITPKKRDRWLKLIAFKKGRRKLRATLAHSPAFDPSATVPLSPDQQRASSIYMVLASLGAPQDCYLISENSDWNAKAMDLEQALRSVVGYGFGTVISCIPGALAYYEGEGPGHRLILRRRL